jgi:hypothetical protein
MYLCMYSQGLLLLFGALMSFSTRSVSENFNESRSIALSIYNVLFTLAVVILLALLQQSDGRTLIILVISTIYWVTLGKKRVLRLRGRLILSFHHRAYCVLLDE